VEGKTEKAFLPALRTFLETRLSGNMPKLDMVPQGGRLPTGPGLKRLVDGLMDAGKSSADAVIALTDVYTDRSDREFENASEAKRKMKEWVGANPSFHPHAAQHDFEAWLIPYWNRVKEIAKSDRNAPSSKPETVNHTKPPSRHLEEIFRTGGIGKSYIKSRDAARILDGQDLTIAANACPELKSFLNTILRLCKAEELL
jgi:hypothetical protein